MLRAVSIIINVTACNDEDLQTMWGNCGVGCASGKRSASIVQD